MMQPLLIGLWTIAAPFSPGFPASSGEMGEVGEKGAAVAPATIVVATARGEASVRVSGERGYAALPVPALQALLPMTHGVRADWADVRFGGQRFRFLLGGALFTHGGRVVPLVGPAYVARDTLFVPLQWLADYIPRLFREGYRYDPLAGRFEEARLQPVVTRTTPAVPRGPGPAWRPPSDVARRHGFRTHHKVVLDPGHGGPDPGNPGVYLPRGVQEKHVTLAIAGRVAAELAKRGIEAVLTRTTDTLINLSDRAPMCLADCDLFVSIHVNSLPPRRGAGAVGGLETYFLGDALTADAARVAAMENEALRYETGSREALDDALSFIFKDLHANEYLRESALLAATVQRTAARVHPGGDRGVQQNRFVVLATARRPAILIETGFATNRRDAAYLASPAGQQELARAIAEGIAAYLRQYENKVLSESMP